MSARMRLPKGLVTFLFTDIESSTRLAQMLGAEYRAMLIEHRRVIRAALSTADGVELFTEGDSLFVAFPDASAALSACAQAQRRLAGHDWPVAHPPRVRMGLHTGYAQPYGGEYATPEVHRAARIAASAHGGQILCSASTASHSGELPADAWLRDLGLHRLRGFDGRERLFQLVAPGLEEEFPRPRGGALAAHNLPAQLTTFVGRAAERRELRALLSRHRMVTVVGAGGAGKTRLAIELARQVVDEYPDGVWFTDLAGIDDPDLVEVSVADALGLRREPGRQLVDTIADHTADQRLLILLDTCDTHRDVAAGLTDRLLRAGSTVNVLATSREPLNLPGEVVWRIPPLALSPDGPDRPSEAVTLLLERAYTARGGRPVLPHELADLYRIAAAMDGLPLALELAAARLRVLSTAQLASRVHDLLAVLDAGLAPRPGSASVRVPLAGVDERNAVDEPAAVGGGCAVDEPAAVGDRAAAGLRAHKAADRHRTMEATVGWSYRTLPPEAARLLRWLSVFAGPVDLSTVESVLGADPLDPLATLVDKSLLQAESGVNGPVYRVLDAIRAYAARRLRETGDEAAARNRHVAWCLHTARHTDLDGDGRPGTVSLYNLDPLADELRAALHWTVAGGSARDGFAVAMVLDQWWRERGLAREGRRWLTRLYDRMIVAGEQMPPAELAMAHHIHGGQAGADGDYGEELAHSLRAEETAMRVDDPALITRVLAGRGAPLLSLGRVAEAERLCRQVIDFSRRENVPGEALSAVYSLAQLMWQRGALDEAAGLLAAARPLEQAKPVERGRRTVDMILGLVALSRGDLIAAHDHIVVALRARMGRGFQSRACETLSAFAVRCALGGDPLLAARLFGAAQAARARLRVPSGILGQYWTSQQAHLRATLGDQPFDAAYAEGNTLTLEEATALALTVEHPDLVLGSRRFSDVDTRMG